jgi:DNA-binding LacI/PurR family transcriptional regulator
MNMNKTPRVKLPFSVDRANPSGLAEQIANGLTSAFRSGYYAPGDRLPNIRDIAAQLDVSEMAVRAAVGQLAAAGEVVARRKTGIRVADVGKRAWQAHVLFVYLSDTYYFTARNRQLLHLMDEANIRLTAQMLGGLDNQEDLARLRGILDCQSVDLVMLDGMAAGLISEFTQRRLPFITVGTNGGVTPSPLAVASLKDDQRPAFAALARHAADCGVRTVTGVSPSASSLQPLEEALAAVGIRFSMVGAPLAAKPNGSLAVERDGYEAVQAVLAQRPLPDLLYVGDDYAARGGLVALLAAGIRLPEDLQFVTWVNKGFCPVFPKPLTRIENDPLEHAQVYCDLVRSALRTARPARPPASLGPHFVIGGTTRKRENE